jgi:hypothetical protein
MSTTANSLLKHSFASVAERSTCSEIDGGTSILVDQSKPRTPRLNREQQEKLNKIREDLQKGRAAAAEQSTAPKTTTSSSSASSINQLVAKRNDSRMKLGDLNLEYELWSKVAKKMLESILRKALLNMNIMNNKKQLTASSGSSQFEVEFLDPNEKSHFAMSKYNSPASKLATTSSTLKRANDIKINLSKMLDKRSLEILASISGSFIHHNCNNVNKHGVVINTNGFLFL